MLGRSALLAALAHALVQDSLRGASRALKRVRDQITFDPTAAPVQILGGKPPQSHRTVAMDKRAAIKARNKARHRRAQRG